MSESQALPFRVREGCKRGFNVEDRLITRYARGDFACVAVKDLLLPFRPADTREKCPIGEGEEPGLEGATAREALELLPGRDEGFLGEFVRGIGIVGKAS